MALRSPRPPDIAAFLLQDEGAWREGIFEIEKRKLKIIVGCLTLDLWKYLTKDEGSEKTPNPNARTKCRSVAHLAFWRARAKSPLDQLTSKVIPVELHHVNCQKYRKRWWKTYGVPWHFRTQTPWTVPQRSTPGGKQSGLAGEPEAYPSTLEKGRAEGSFRQKKKAQIRPWKDMGAHATIF